jgi:hypothetical protein
MDARVESAWIAGGVAILTALFSVALTVYVQTKTARENRERDAEIASMKARTDMELSRLSATLAQQRDEAAARRDYTYEALKRLYREVNPLLFRLREHCVGSLDRIRRIVREDFQVASEQHLLTSTQRLVAPLVVAQELQRHLSAVDLSVDPTIRAQYIVSRELLWILHEGPAIASADPAIAYREEDKPEEHVPRQHLTFAQLQRLVDVFTVPDADDGTRRPLKLIELEDRQGRDELANVLKRVKTLFASASAASTPVLWRLLIAEASLMHVLVDLIDRGSANVERVLPIDIEGFEWQPGAGPSFKSQVGAVDSYLREKLGSIGHCSDGASTPVTGERSAVARLHEDRARSEASDSWGRGGRLGPGGALLDRANHIN